MVASITPCRLARHMHAFCKRTRGSAEVHLHVIDVRLLVEYQGARGSFLPGKPRLSVAGDAPDLLASDHHFRQQRVHHFAVSKRRA